MGNKDSKYFNVVSASGLQCTPGQIMSAWESLDEGNDPDDDGWMTQEQMQALFGPGYIGRLTIRDALATNVGDAIGRTTPYDKRQANNLMKETRALEKARWPVQSIPVIDRKTMTALVDDAVAIKRRRVTLGK